MNPEEMNPRTQGSKKQSGLSRYMDGLTTGVLATLLFVLLLMTGKELYYRYRPSREPGEEARTTNVLSSSDTAAKMREVEGLINHYYLNGIDEERLEKYLYYGIVAGLDDKYADYYSAEELRKTMEGNEGVYFGIGCTLVKVPEDGKVLVREVQEGTPADRAGLKKGDRILTVAGWDVEEETLTDLVMRIRSMTEDFEIEICRESEDQPLTITVACEKVEEETVSWRMLEDRIGYLSLEKFEMISVDQFREAVDRLTDQGARGLIIDLRNNPGGMLTAVCDIVDYLLPDQGLILYTEDKNGNREEYLCKDGCQTELPLAVLVNGSSASGAEVFAGAVRDRGAGVIIGSRTYGKGVVQNTFRLSDGSGVKFTISHYYTPKGQDIDGNGITPDIPVAEPGPETGVETSDEPDGGTSGESDGGTSGEPDRDDGFRSDPVLRKAWEVLAENGTETDLPGTADRAS